MTEKKLSPDQQKRRLVVSAAATAAVGLSAQDAGLVRDLASDASPAPQAQVSVVVSWTLRHSCLVLGVPDVRCELMPGVLSCLGGVHEVLAAAIKFLQPA